MDTRIVRFLFGTTIALATALMLLVLPTPTSSASTTTTFDVYVDTTTDEFGGSACSLREAIETANNNTDFAGCFRLIYNASNPPNVYVPSGTYSLTLTASGNDNNANGDLNIYKSMTLSSTGAVTVTGGTSWTDRIFHIMTGTVGTVTIKGMTISKGSGTTLGGGILIEPSASLSISDSAIVSNSAIAGGGIYNNQGALILANVTLSGNTATCGNCISDGGGIENYFGTATLTNVTLNGNSALNFGGGIYAAAGAMTLTNVTISSNSASNSSAGNNGGGIFAGGPMNLTNVTLDGNGAPSGGGIYVGFDTTRLMNVTLSGNHATNSGGGIYRDSFGTVAITNTIVAISGNGNCNTTLGGSYNLSSDNTCGFGIGDNVNAMLGSLANNGGATKTHALLPGSPAIDAGTNIGCPSTDQRGWHRPFGSNCDIGAYERGAFLFLPLVLR